jgi:hypothetical protein
LERLSCYRGLIIFSLVCLSSTFGQAARAAETTAGGFRAYERAVQRAADGFEIPKGKRVRASAHGQVLGIKQDQDTDSSLVTIEHIYFQNHQRVKIRSLYQSVSGTTIKVGDLVKRGQVIGVRGPKFRFRLIKRSKSAKRPDEKTDPEVFVKTHKRLFMPKEEPTLLLIDAESYRMRHYEKGKQVGEYEVAFGQAKGRKRVRGDNRSPRGMYFVTSKYRGAFTGKYGAYYGGHWIKVNYPNLYDAKWGVQHKKISTKMARSIRIKWSQRKLTPQKTKLGGGIGFHGWIGPWSMTPQGAHLSWGCIVMHNKDITALFDRIPESAMVLIF